MIDDKSLEYEKKKHKYITKILKEVLSDLGQGIMRTEQKIIEFRRFAWDQKGSIDASEMRKIMTDDEVEAMMLVRRSTYFQKLFRIQKNPYFASIIFEDENKEVFEIYISTTHLRKDNKNILSDWRAPICSLYYDYEPGICSYNTPSGVIKGNLKQKRQYKIKDGQLIRVLDSAINIDDDILQEVLANKASEKMKNIVNTIQMEQNSIIRNLKDRNLIVQGIAGSGKTSVALHRIAFLLYRIENLTSSNVLIFSPNNVFTEYISNVLPELGEENTMQTTFQDYLSKMIKEYRKVESFIDFLARYYSGNKINDELIKYKQSDAIIKDVENYIKSFEEKASFTDGITESDIYNYSADELNEMLKDRYNSFPIFQRIKAIGTKLSENNYNGSKKKAPTYQRLLKEVANFKKDYKKIYRGFYQSDFCKIKLTEAEINKFINKKIINYEDALLLVYIKSLLEGFKYESFIKQVVIDEAQDYNKLQYLIINKIFKKSSFTILGDVNQTINPYYKYQSLSELEEIFQGKYIELNKSYRSSENIVEYTNKILNLNNVSAIRKDSEEKIKFEKYNKDIKINLLKTITRLKSKYESIAVICKNDYEAKEIFDLLGEDELSLITHESEEFTKGIIVIPAYMAKGLEFDGVIILNEKSFNIKEKSLLYVACTRAQHELIIFK
ncbi:MAG: AAA family ATPase [Bacilli bacterium]|nr:AAA family ATPase [Bacilli bacterium]